MRYRALRSLHYVQTNGEDKVVQPGEFVVNASESKIEALLADGFVEPVKPAKKED